MGAWFPPQLKQKCLKLQFLLMYTVCAPSLVEVAEIPRHVGGRLSLHGGTNILLGPKCFVGENGQSSSRMY